jgi:hypothetical protein
LLLTQNPFNTNGAEHTCYIHDRWIPRTYPLRAKYNDYGSVEDVQEGLARDIWFEGFQLDLVERGVGDNSCHDVPVRNGMAFEQWLAALWEGRVLVGARRSGKPLSKEVLRELRKGCPPEKVHPGIPTMKRVRKAIQRAGLPLSDGGFAEGYMVNLQRRGFIRVRWGAQENDCERLDALRPILADRFAIVITVGTGSYGNRAEMLVAPKPLPTAKNRKEYDKDPEKYDYKVSFGAKRLPHTALPVAQAMIREDVWQAILKLKHKDGWRPETPRGLEGFRKLAREHWVAYAGYLNLDPKSEEYFDKRLFFRDELRQKNVVSAFSKNEAGLLGLEAHLELMAAHNPKGKVLDDFLDTVGEMSFVQYILAQTRYQWNPGNGGGPQIGEWLLQEKFAKAIHMIAAKEAKRHREE